VGVVIICGHGVGWDEEGVVGESMLCRLRGLAALTKIEEKSNLFFVWLNMLSPVLNQLNITILRVGRSWYA